MHVNDILSHPNRQAIQARFETMFDRLGPDECWPWKRALAHNGYGLFTLWHHQQVRAHRLSYVLYNGPIPVNQAKPRSVGYYVIRHRCHNPICVNPAHLRYGTPQQNTADMLEAGRFWGRGEENHGAKLTVEQVKAIRLDTRHPLDIAATYGVDRGTIQNIQTGRTWKSVKSPFAQRPVWLSGAEGRHNGRAKLTDADVLAIRADPRPYPVVAAEYGLNRESIGFIKRRVTWKHLP